jgi:hypothetical protein
MFTPRMLYGISNPKAKEFMSGLSRPASSWENAETEMKIDSNRKCLISVSTPRKSSFMTMS